MRLCFRRGGCVLLCLGLLLGALVHADDLEQVNKLMRGNRFADAEQRAEKLLPNATGQLQLDLLYQLAMARLRQYKHDPAIATFAQVIAHPLATNELKASSLMGQGQCYHLSQRLDQALAVYDQAVQLADVEAPTLNELHLRRGFAYGKLGRPDDAVAAFKIAAAVPGVSSAHQQSAYVKAGMVRQGQQRYHEATELYERALALGENGAFAENAKNYLLECRAAEHADPHFYIAPFVTLVSPTEASIIWVSRSGSPAGQVTVTGGGETFTATAEQTVMVDRDAYRQQVKLNQLKPYTLYEYEARTADHTATGAFHTARSEPGPIRFIVFGDTQGGWEAHQELAHHMAAEKPDFVLHVGDCVEQGQRWDEWKIQMFDPGRPYLSRAPIWVARGNHDGGAYFPILFGREKQPWQTFTFANLQVFVLDSNYYMGVTSGVKQLAWLEDQLANSTSRWQVVTMHHSLFHTANGDTLMGQSNFRPLLEQASPDLIFNGHYHKYSRQLPIGVAGRKPLLNVVTGGGGGGNGTPSTMSPIVAHSYESFHYCVVAIDGDTLDLTVKDLQGQVLDHYQLNKNSQGLFQDEVMHAAVDPALFAQVRMIYHDLKAPSYNRVDLTGVYADGQITLDRNLLDLTRLPPQTQLRVERAEDCNWTLAKQELDLSAGKLTFAATLPEGVTEKQLTTAGLKVVVTLNVAGRDFAPWTFPVSLRPAP